MSDFDIPGPQTPTPPPRFDQFIADKSTSIQGVKPSNVWGAARSGHKHTGQDFGGPINSDVGAADDGEIVFAGPNGNMGNAVKVKHPDGTVSVYGHLNKINVQQGDKVKAGANIGLLGQTGNAKGPHVHFELYQNGLPIDPAGTKYRPQIGLPPPRFDEFTQQAAPRAVPDTAPPRFDEFIKTQELPLKTPSTSVTLGEGAIDESQPVKPLNIQVADDALAALKEGRPRRMTDAPAPIAFEQGSAMPRHAGPTELMMRPFDEPSKGTVSDQLTQQRYKSPPSTELGTAVKIPFSPHLNPTEDDLVKGYLAAMGPEYLKYGEQYKAQTGRNILSLQPGDVDRDADGSAYVKPTRAGVDILNAYVKSGGDSKAAQAEGARIANERRNAVTIAQQQAAPDIAEVQAGRTGIGAMPTAQRAIESPVIQYGAGKISQIGGLVSGFGLAPNRVSDYLNTRGKIMELGSSLPPLTPQGQEIQRGVPEKVATSLTHLGLGVFDIIAMKRVTGLSTGQVMALESALQDSSDPLPQRAARTAQAYAMGKLLDSHLDRITSAGMFGVPTGVESAQAVARGEKSKTDALLDTAIQGGMGALLGKDSEAGSPASLNIEGAMRVGVPGEVTVNIDTQLAAREAAVKPVMDAQGNVLLNADEVAQGGKPKVRLAQKRSVRNAKTVSGDEYDQLARALNRALNIETKTPAKQVETATEKNVTPKGKLNEISRPDNAASQIKVSSEAGKMDTAQPVAARDVSTGLQPETITPETEVRLAQRGMNETQIKTLDENSGRSPSATSKTLPIIARKGVAGQPTASQEPAPVEKGALAVAPQPELRHVDLQPRTPEGQFDQETPAQAEARRQQVAQSVSTPQPEPTTQASPATPDAATNLLIVPPIGAERSASTPKEPWEMTQEENRSRGVEYQKQFATQQPESWYAAKADANHKMMVERAIGEGKLVPPEVLKDYPDLAKKVGAASEVVPMPEVKYHVTTADRLADIAQNGLTPNAKEAIGGAAYSGTKKGKVFVSDEGGVDFWKQRAERFIEHNYDDYAKKGIAPVVLRVRPGLLKPDDVGTKDAGYPSHTSEQAIKPENIEAWNGSRWIPIKDFAEIDLGDAFDSEGYLNSESSLQKPDFRVAQPAPPVPEGKPAQAEPPPEQKPTQVKPSDPSMTSARKADIASDRVEWDLTELPPSEHQPWLKARREALIDRLNASDKAGAIAKAVLDANALGNEYPLTRKQTAGLVLRMQDIKNEYTQLRGQIYSLDPSSEKMPELKARYEILQSEMDRLQRATDIASSEKGRTLNFQKFTVNPDLDLVSMTAHAKAKGLEMTTDRRSRYEAMDKEINGDPSAPEGSPERLGLKAQIAKHESDAKAQSLQAEVNRASRRVKRTQAKQTLDDEAAVIKSNIAAEFARLKSGQSRTLSQGGLGALDPDGVITKELAKYLRNRVQSGVNDAAQILDDAYALVKEHVEDITKGDVLDALLAPQRRKQGDLARQMKTVRDELDAMAVTEGRRTKQPQGPKITDAPPVGPTQTYAKTRTAQLLKREAELTRRIREQDYSPSSKRPPIVYNEPLNRLNARVESLRRQYEHDLEANKKVTVPDMLVRWKRFAVLTYPTTFGKLGSAATARMITSPIEELLGSGLGRVPGLKTVFSGPRGKGRLSAETKVVSQLWQSQSFKDMLAHVKGGDDMLSLLYGKHAGDEFYSGSDKGSYVPTTFKDLTDRPGHYHAAMKTIPKRAEFYRSFENRLESARSEGRDVHDPAVQMGLAGEAYVDAQRAILQQPNFLSDAFNRWAGGLEHSQSALGRGLGKAMRFEFPITRVPVNFVGESALHIGGLPAALGETAVRGLSGKLADSKSSSLRSLAERMPDRLDKLEPAQKDRIARAFKKGGVGLGFLAWGMLRPQDFGGYYQPGQRAPDDLKAGQMRFFGVKLPRWMGHIPVLEAAQFGATIRRVYDSMSAKGKSPIEAVEGGATAATTGIAKEVPMLDPLIEGVRAFKQPIGKTVGEQVKGLEPGLAQWGARTLDYGPEGSLAGALNPFGDQEPVKRKQKTGAETIKEGLPFIRSTLPVSSVFPKASKASDEVQRLGISLYGARQGKDETGREFKEREGTQNAAIRESIETLVSNPDYDKLSNKEKAEQIKAAKDFAVKNTVKPIRNIKDLKPALMQSAPSPSPNLLY